MSPHHFANLTKNHKISEKERESEERIEHAVKAAVEIIAVPFKALIGKGSPDKD